MIYICRYVVVLLLINLLITACASSAASTTAPAVEATNLPTEPGPVMIDTLTPAPTIMPSPTAEKLQLEVVQIQAWTDLDGHVRTNVLVRNPYTFAVRPRFGGRANLLNSAGELIRDRDLYFLDGISGGAGFLLPGETIAANACFTCESTPLEQTWSAVEFSSSIEEATGQWEYSTEVEATASVSFSGDSPIFDVAGTVTNKSDHALQRISVRVFVFDQQGNLVGAAEASAWEVPAGATVGLSGYGIGQAPEGEVDTEVNALGVNY
jgi:hypothetical protein